MVVFSSFIILFINSIYIIASRRYFTLIFECPFCALRHRLKTVHVGACIEKSTRVLLAENTRVMFNVVHYVPRGCYVIIV